MTPNSGSTNTTLITFVVVVFVALRFAAQELKPRIVHRKTLWVRPVFIAVVAVAFAVIAFSSPGIPPALVGAAIMIGGVLGAVTGRLVLRFTTFRPAGIPNAVTVIGSRESASVWIVAIALRFAARVLFLNAGTQIDVALNAALLALLAVAFVVVALEIHRAVTANAGG